MKQNNTVVLESKAAVKLTVGLDLGDRFSYYCVLNVAGEKQSEGKVATQAEALEELLRELGPTCVAMEAGTHSPWVSRLVERCGSEAIVADTRRVPAIWQNRRKSDRVDAEMLARLARVDRQLLQPIHHRGEQAQQDLSAIRARDALVRARTMLINTVRGLVKGMGLRVPKCSSECFPRRMAESLPLAIQKILRPCARAIEELNQNIRGYDRKLSAIARKRYRETRFLRQVQGVGPLTSLAYVLTLEDPQRFARSRTVAAYLGLTPRRDQSGDREPQLGISKAGNEYLRRLLVSSAQYVLGRYGKPCELREWGLRLAQRGGKNAKKRAVVAVARKLAVLLHRLWVSRTKYEPWRRSSPPAMAVAA
jgi:transposase